MSKHVGRYLDGFSGRSQGSLYEATSTRKSGTKSHHVAPNAVTSPMQAIAGCSRLLVAQDIAVAAIENGHRRAPEELAAGGSEFDLDGERVSKGTNPPKSVDRLLRWAASKV